LENFLRRERSDRNRDRGTNTGGDRRQGETALTEVIDSVDRKMTHPCSPFLFYPISTGAASPSNSPHELRDAGEAIRQTSAVL